MCRTLARVVLSIILLVILNFVPVNGWAKFALYLVPYLIAGYDVLLESLDGIREREIFDENFLMSIATIGALCLAYYDDGNYIEASAVMIFYKIGELFEDYAVDKSRENITNLKNLKPDYANIEVNSSLERVPPESVKTGSIIIVKPGEKIPIDGVIISGSSALDMKALTGESLPKNFTEGDEVISGSVNLERVIKIRTTREYKDSTAAKILELVENSSTNKAKTEKFISRFAKFYTPAVCICALGLAFIPALITGWANFDKWLYRSLTFLVISCPCALVISIPLTFFAGIGGAGRAGILVKGSNFLERLSKISCAVFDKTGTLTRGVFEVTAMHPDIIDSQELLHLAAHVERFSNHPVAESLKRAYQNESDSCIITQSEEIPGYGVRAKVNNNIICVGNAKFMSLIKADLKPCEKCSKSKAGTIIHVAINNIYAGHIVISDIIKQGSKSAIEKLKASGVKKIIMLTGDNYNSAKEVADSLGINEFYSELLPADKVSRLENLSSSGITAFIGDGINDAPVIARADVGIAMGALGSDAAIEAADVVLMDDDPQKVSQAVKISRKVMRIVKQNIYFSVGIKLLCLALGAMGLADMWLAVFADVGVMILAVLNAVRALFV
ncbi:MAG: heavy metal translocating P-type ATPase [Synergistaceae bacterium]|nr:heavy metal translocating P-type ATPase [Synergistaceae bacterium]